MRFARLYVFSILANATLWGACGDNVPGDDSGMEDPPETTITAGPSGDTPLGAASFTFSSDTGTTFECQLDGAAFSACLSPLPVTVTEGAHTFAVRAVNGKGLADPSPATRAYRGLGSGTGTRIRLVAANLTSGNQQSYDPGHGGRILDGLNPDIVMIQEFNYFPGNGTTEIRNWVTSVFGANYNVYREPVAAANPIPNGVISKYPIVGMGVWENTASPNREFVWTRIDVPGAKDLWAISVHLLTNDNAREGEATQLRGYINANVPAGDYLVIGGDFNTDTRTEPSVTVLSQIVDTAAPYPVDQAGDGDTNASRGSPYDWLMLDADLKAKRVPVVIGANSFANGLIVDTRVYNPIADLAPAMSTDSGASMMQHMAVVMDVSL